MGIYRFVLALFVFLNHIPGHTVSFQVANSAVIGFYFISGLLVTKSLNEFSRAHNSIAASLHFYIDRLIRLWPLFFISIALIVLSRLFITHTITWSRDLFHTIWSNLTILPLAFAATLPEEKIINGVTWSLGSEFIFYLALPVFFYLPKAFRIGICWIAVSLHLACLYLDHQAVFYYTYQGLGFPSPKPASLLYGYFFPLFSIAPFFMGALYTLHEKKWPVVTAYLGYAAVFFAFGQAGAAMANSGVFDVVFGILIFVPLAVLLEKYRFESPAAEKLNSYLGLLSYPVFIIHVLAIDIVMYIFPTNTLYRFVVAYLIVFALCPLLVLLQKRVDSLRYKLRGFGRTKEQMLSKGGIRLY